MSRTKGKWTADVGHTVDINCTTYSPVHAQKRGRIILCKRLDDAKYVAICGNYFDELLAAAKQTLSENGHLADGDVCTLKVLKDAVAKIEGAQ